MKVATRKMANNWLPSLIDEMLQNDFNGGSTLRNFVPAVNVKETDSLFELELVIPGFSKEEVEIAIDNDVLSIASVQSEENNEQLQDSYMRKEFTKGAFKRSFTIPDTVNQDDIDANCANGILHMTLPKKEEALPQPKRIITLK